MRSWTASAPGKLLLAGGYLVLESPHQGVVIGVDKRFYCTVVVHHHSEKSDNDDNNDNDNDNDNDNNNVIPILVQSPQLVQEWKYEWHCTDLTLHPLVTTNANGFIEKTLRVTLLALQLDNNNNNTKKTKNVSLLELILRGDNDFYSLVPHLLERNLPLTWSGAAQLPPFLPAPRRRSNANNNGHQELLKTGLGSSACLVTSVVAALVMALSSTSSSTSTSSSIPRPKLNEEEEEDQRAVNNNDKKNNMMNNKLLTMDETTLTTIFRLAQICHCHAQGKVGSGFDVAAACYGSHIYQRIPQSVLAPVLTLLEEENNEDDKHKHNHHPDRVLAIQQCLLDQLSMTNPLWTTKEQGGGVQAPLSIPSYIQVMLADVSGGSESPSMARTVLQWKEQQQQAKTEANRIPYWDDLAQLNAKVGQLWQELSHLSEEPSMTEVESLANTPAHQWVAQATTTTPLRPFATTTITTTTTTTTESVTQRRRALLWELSQTLQETRRQLKAMGEAAQVPIEPNEQTAVANATMALPGVIAALVPGAGGYDALACIYINTDSVRNAMDQLWSTWTWTWQGGGDALDNGNGKNNDALRQAATVDRDPTTSVTIATGETSTNMASATNKVICPLTVQAISYGQGVQIVEHLTLPTNPA